ncbi:chalcone isomerase family protein [Pseudomonas sp. NW5]|uniref:chalcone isomerase family protein n=1 Tax=Pseudomonas sp. NW5 TaxID=2934934 RepID=UPI0020208B41|nr:chalcone isomerase family protein [Pseudomonas sp. NW5]MCL7462101.1 chalcone isomerase family protein [Pseudomonas sp. NW5]
MNTLMKRWARWSSALALWAGLLLTAPAQASWQESLPQAEVLGTGELRLFGFRIYSARLWSREQPLTENSPFALELTYHRDISRQQLVEASQREIRRLFGTQVSDQQLSAWQVHMQQAFVDVTPGAKITGVYLPGTGARFYAGNRLQHAVDDAEFARAFFAIWLDPRTRNPELRAQLLGRADR